MATLIEQKQTTKTFLALGLFITGAGLIAASAFLLIKRVQRTTSLPIDSPIQMQGANSLAFVPGEVLVKIKSGVDINILLPEVLAEPQIVYQDQQSGKTFGPDVRDGFDNANNPVERTVKIELKDSKQLFVENSVAPAIKEKIAKRRGAAIDIEQTSQEIGLDRWQKIRVNNEVDIKDLVKRFLANPNIEKAEPNYIDHVEQFPRKVPIDDGTAGSSGPNDFYFLTDQQTFPAFSWGQNFPDLWGLKRIGFPSGWNTTKGSQGTVVAVSDTGIDYQHPDLQGKIWLNAGEIPANNQDDDANGYVDDVRGYDFSSSESKPRDADPMDDHGHGTHVAGTIGAATNNSIGVAGIGWQVKLMAVKGLDSTGSGSHADLAAGLQYAADNGADVINMSWGGTGVSSVRQEGIEYAHALGVVLVAAAGNSDSDVAGFYPASYDGVITVAAWCPSNYLSTRCTASPIGSRASFSNWGNGIDVTAPGVEVLSLRSNGTDMYLGSINYVPGSRVVGGQFYRASGTSMAAPHVAGLAALMRSLYPTISFDQILSVLTLSSEDVLTPGKDIYSGYGLINAPQALQLTKSVATGLGQAELAVEKAEVNWTSIHPGGAHAGEIHATIHNFGFREATNIKYQAFLGDSGNQILAIEGTLLSLQPGEAQDVTQSFTLTNPPSLAGTFTVDPHQIIAEYLETNNTLGLTVSYPTANGWPKTTGDDIIGSPSIADLDRGYPGLETIIGSYDGKVYAWHADGTLVPGWPISLAGLYIYSSPAVADLDGDGNLEVVIGSYWDDSKVFAWHWNGQPVAGWPKLVGTRVDSSPAVADLDPSYPGLEVVVGAANSNVYAWHADGSDVSGWPRGDISYQIVNSLSIGDVDPAYPGLEVVAGGEFDRNFYVWHADGTVVLGWPILLSAEPYSSPALADIDGDGRLEILIGTKDGKVHARRADGTLVPGWPQTLMYNYVHSSPVISDLDPSYPGLEIIAGATDGYDEFCYCTHSVFYAWHADGTLLNGWPKNVSNTATYSSPALADLDGDGRLEIVVGAGDASVYGWHVDGTAVVGFPLRTTGGNWSSPAVADLDGNGTLEVVIGSGDSNVYAWSMPWTSLQTSQPWPVHRHDSQRTGQYDATVGVGGGGGGGDNEPPIIRPIRR